MYKVNGLFSFPARRKLRELDFRAPEDSLSVDEGDEKEVRSPGIDRMIKAYYDADHVGDDSEKAAALRGMIDEMTALHKLRGVPVFAHPPLPPQFVAAQVDGAKYAGGTDIISKIASLIEPNNRPSVRMQFEGPLARQRGSLANALFPQAPESGGALALLARQKPDAAREAELRGGAPKRGEKPTDKAEEDARRANCENYRRDVAQQRRAIDDADRQVAQRERRIQDLRAQRQNWLTEIAEIEADLRVVRSRSTDPDVPIIVCPRTGRDPLKPPRGRRERRRDQEEQIQEGLCQVVGRIDRELAKDRWRERLEQAKAEEIRELEAELRAARQEVQKIDGQIAQALEDQEEAKHEVRVLQDGLGWIFEKYKDPCGDRR